MLFPTFKVYKTWS